MKAITILLTALLSLFTLSAFAKPNSSNIALDGLYEHGIYVGGQIAYINPHNERANYAAADIFLPIIGKTGSRLYAGYRFNDYIAAEAGYNWIMDESEKGGLNNAKKHARMSAFDILGKGILPFNRYFSGFAKAGIARVHQDILDSVNGGATTIYKSDATELLPVVGLGLTYHLTTKFAADAGWTHMFSRKDIDAIDMYGVGISYTF